MGIGKELIARPVKQILTKRENRRYEIELAKKCPDYDSWVRVQEKLMELSGESGEIEGFHREDIVIFAMSSGRLSECAEQLIYAYFAQHPEVQLLYGDEDVSENGRRRLPWYKPDWSPDVFDSWYYFGSVTAVRRALLKQCRDIPEEFIKEGCDMVLVAEDDAAGRLPSVICQCLELCGSWQRGTKTVGHIPEILFHCDSREQQAQYRLWRTEHFCPGEDAEALLSIIIPSKDNPDILENCIKAIAKTEKKLNYELIIVDNGSNETNRKRVEALLREYFHGTTQGRHPKPQYIYQPMEFNFSVMCNLGAERAGGKLLLFLNDDVELTEASCLDRLAALALRDYTGAVGMKLYYPASGKIQHAGITNLPMGPVHKLQFLEDEEEYYYGFNRGLRNVLAVTAACLMVEKQKFLKAGGFDEELQVAFNDVDFCFRLWEQGYYNVCNNDCYAYHHESLSRGADESTEKWLRLIKERNTLYGKHQTLEGRDPFYGAGLGREGLDTRVRPKYETAGNRLQELWSLSAVGVLEPGELAAYRQDNCLMLRIENCRQGCLQGYGVILGDNNACYEKDILLSPLSDEGTDSGKRLYRIHVEGQYRPDLVENLPDQINVGLCGFWMKLSGGRERCCLKKGTYRIGMTARNRVTGLRLINWSSRIMTVE